MVLYNRPFKIMVEGKGFFPTVMKLPTWATPPVIGQKALVTVGPKSIGVVEPYSEEGLLGAPEFEDAPVTLEYGTIESYMKEIAPIGEAEIAEWMHSAAACNCVLSARMEEYKRAGSAIVAASDDPYIPGLKVEDLKVRSELAKTVADRGYGIVESPAGNFNCPVPGKATGVFPDLLCWSSVVEAFLVQWTSALVKFRELATNPSSKIGFINTRGLTAPLFFGHSSEMLPFPVNMVEMSVSSDKAQSLGMNARSTDDYTDIMFSDRFALSKGENLISFQTLGIPFVPPMVMELQPDNETSTILNYYRVSP